MAKALEEIAKETAASLGGPYFDSDSAAILAALRSAVSQERQALREWIGKNWPQSGTLEALKFIDSREAGK